MNVRSDTSLERLRSESIKTLLTSLLRMGANSLTPSEKFLLRNILLKEPGAKGKPIRLTPLRKEIFNSGIRKLNERLSYLRTNTGRVDKLKQERSQLKNRLNSLETAITFYNEDMEKVKKLKSEKIRETSLSTRLKNICHSGSIRTVFDLVCYSRRRFFLIRGSGKKMIEEIEAYMQERGLTWEMYSSS